MKISTRNMTDKELTEFINVMIKIDPNMDFCKKFYRPIIALDSDIKTPCNSILNDDVDNLRCSDVFVMKSSSSDFIIGRSIYMLFVGKGMVELSEDDFIQALNQKGISKSIKAYIKLYFHLEKPKPKKEKVKK